MNVPNSGVNGGWLVEAGGALLLCGWDDVLLARLLVEHIPVVVHAGQVARRPAAEEVEPVLLVGSNHQGGVGALVNWAKKEGILCASVTGTNIGKLEKEF